MTDLINLQRNAASVVESPSEVLFTGVRIYVGKDENGEELYYSVGGDARPLEIQNPWGTQRMAQRILLLIAGEKYRPMQANSTLLDPAAEMGDGVSVNGVYSVIARRDTTFGSLVVSDIYAPGDGELGHEYKYESKANRELQREINQASSQFIVQLDEIKGQVTDDQGNYTVLTLKSDGLYVGGNSTTIGGSNITDGTIGTSQIATGAITGTKIASNSIQTGHINTGAITTSKLDADCVTSAKIAAGAVDTEQLAASAVTANEIASHTITSNEIRLRELIRFYASTGTTSYAQIGYGEGYDGTNTTYGAMLAEKNGSNYFIVTNAGARMTASSNDIYVTASGCFSSEDMTTVSDARIKEDVNDDLTVFKDILMRLRPVSFRYKPEWSQNHRLQTGFIAQEVEAAVAECGGDDWAVTNITGDDIHCIKDGALISVLVACVQDLTREVAELKEQLNG